MYHTIFFDLDNTLYPSDSGLWKIIGNRIDTYIEKHVHMDKEKISEFRVHCREKFGTTLMGLKNLYEIDDDHYMNYVHDVDLSTVLGKNEELIQMLASLPQRKIIFTSSNVNHARNVLNYLEIEDYFDEILDSYKTAPYIKPQQEAFMKALDLVDIESSQGCIFVDDILDNVQSAKEVGFFSILVSKNSDDDYPFKIEKITQLPQLLKKH